VIYLIHPNILPLKKNKHLTQKDLKLGLLTCKRLSQLTEADQKIQAMLMQRGIQADALVWDDAEIEWENYDLLIFRNTWDYYEKETEFRLWLDHIEKMKIPTLNSIDVVKKNIHKFYLRDLENKGVKIIPTVFIDKASAFSLIELMPAHWAKAVIKPAFSAASYLTEVVTKENIVELNERYKVIGLEKDLLFQQFMPEVQYLGETSLLFFNRKFSHAVCKFPKKGDFRVQSQFGGNYVPTKVPDSIMQQVDQVLTAIEGDLLFARVDGIIIEDEFYLMEVELIEPDLYLDHYKEAFNTFVNAILQKI
jgi:glutathione synthase/RimK-type ligase-like ATP-grasp enzyme